MKKYFLVAGFVFVFFIFGSAAAQAATLYFSPSSGSYTVGDLLPVGVLVNTQGKAINTVETTINFPSNFLEVFSVSKSNSIFSLWVEEPRFSNSAGTISFVGGLPTPGFNGLAGKIIDVVFRVKNSGSATLVFASGAVRADDGYGTDILQTRSQARFSLLAVEVAPEVERPPIIGTPAAPVISSPTHPDPEKWYSNNSPKFVWKVPTDVTAVRLGISRSAVAVPGVLYEPVIAERHLEDLDEGIWYFSAQFRNRAGWGAIGRFKFQIDTVPPLPLEIRVKEGNKTTNPNLTLFFEAIDETSGIDYYEVRINLDPPVRTKETEYQISTQDLGNQTVIVKAVDKAGNSTLAMTEIEILAIEAPIITEYPKELLPGSILSIKGTALPEVTIKVYIQKDGKDIKTGETKSDKDGRWSFIEVEPVERGVYEIWAEAIDIFGAKSKPSEKVTVLVGPPVFVRIGKLAIDYLTTVVSLFGLILVIIFILFWFWEKMQQKKRKLKKEVSEAEKALYQAFKALKEEAEEQVAKLDGKPGLTKTEKGVRDKLQEALNISEEFIGKEIKDVEKELE